MTRFRSDYFNEWDGDDRRRSHDLREESGDRYRDRWNSEDEDRWRAGGHHPRRSDRWDESGYGWHGLRDRFGESERGYDRGGHGYGERDRYTPDKETYSWNTSDRWEDRGELGMRDDWDTSARWNGGSSRDRHFRNERYPDYSSNEGYRDDYRRSEDAFNSSGNYGRRGSNRSGDMRQGNRPPRRRGEYSGY